MTDQSWATATGKARLTTRSSRPSRSTSAERTALAPPISPGSTMTRCVHWPAGKWGWCRALTPQKVRSAHFRCVAKRWPRLLPALRR